jgi:hypothetical protein
MRYRDDQPTIGQLPCPENNEIAVECALRDGKKPVGMPQWKTKRVDSRSTTSRRAVSSAGQVEREPTKSQKLGVSKLL